MNQMTAKDITQGLLQRANIVINGDNPWDIQIHHHDFYARVIKQGSLGLGEAYMDKWWDCEALDTFFERVLRAQLDSKINISFPFYFKLILAKIINLQTKRRARQVADQHYDLGNHLFSAMLDKHMMYSCGYWKEASSLEEAQHAKLALICEKLQLRPGMRLLDIGCGWGGLAKYAAEHHGVSVVGITISKEQCEFAQRFCAHLPVEIKLLDYRELNDAFDRIVSVGMFEHVGPLNYDTYMHSTHRLLKDDGLFLLHTIGNDVTGSLANEWIVKYIFPNGMLPSLTQIAKSAESLFVIEDMHNFGADYDKTLMAWHENFVKHWDALTQYYDERFYRMWRYYLLACAGNFRARTNQLWQFVFSKGGVPGGYRAPR